MGKTKTKFIVENNNGQITHKVRMPKVVILFCDTLSWPKVIEYTKWTRNRMSFPLDQTSAYNFYKNGLNIYGRVVIFVHGWFILLSNYQLLKSLRAINGPHTKQ